jgi:hypothetical protein
VIGTVELVVAQTVVVDSQLAVNTATQLAAEQSRSMDLLQAATVVEAVELADTIAVVPVALQLVRKAMAVVQMVPVVLRLVVQQQVVERLVALQLAVQQLAVVR